MRKSVIIVPDLHQVPGQAHAVRIDDILYTSCFAAVDRQGRSISTDVRAQIRHLHQSLTKVLDRAGASWRDVARVCYYAPPGLSPGMRELIEECLAEAPLWGKCATTTAHLGTGAQGATIKAELTAHIGGEKRPFAITGQEHTAGVRIGQHIYLSSQIASTAAGLAEETHEIYSRFDALLTDADGRWDDALRVRQYVTDTNIDFNDVRAGRETFLPAGNFLSTSVASLAPADDRDGPAITIDLEAVVAPKVTISTSAVPPTPGTAHAIRVGSLVHLQAQIAEANGMILYPGDVTGQTLHVLGTLTEMMAAAGVGWDQVVTSRVFCRDPAHLSVVRQLERDWAGYARFAHADLVARFFDPDVLVEMEITAHR
ncbi:MAG: RidA family protein [Parvibaculaceae bacterium]